MLRFDATRGYYYPRDSPPVFHLLFRCGPMTPIDEVRSDSIEITVLDDPATTGLVVTTRHVVGTTGFDEAVECESILLATLFLVETLNLLVRERAIPSPFVRLVQTNDPTSRYLGLVMVKRVPEVLGGVDVTRCGHRRIHTESRSMRVSTNQNA